MFILDLSKSFCTLRGTFLLAPHLIIYHMKLFSKTHYVGWGTIGLELVGHKLHIVGNVVEKLLVTSA